MGQKPPALGVKFGSDPKQLAFFLTQVWTYMQEYGGDLPIEGANVWCVILALERAAVEWMVALHNKDAPDSAKIRMKTINQGERSMVAYRQEFCSLVCRLTE